MEGLIRSILKMPARESYTSMAPCQFPWTKCCMRSGVRRSAAERSVKGMHPVFVYRFAIEAYPSWECVCRRVSQSSMQLMAGRSSSGVLAVVGQ